MNNDFERFLGTFDSPNTIKVMKNFEVMLNRDWNNCTPALIETVILSAVPKSPKDITTRLFALSKYADFLCDDDMKEIVRDIDRKVLWKLAKPRAERKFISYLQFRRIYEDIELYNDYNAMYIQTLFRSVYEGIYCDDMSVVKNLRSSDISDTGIQLKPDNGESYCMSVSDGLSKDLIKLGDIDIWERRNRYGTCKIKTTGLYDDTCFKVENRKGSAEYAYRFSYYRILRNISKEYVGYDLLPLQLYVSGIMHRISIELKEHGVSICEAFSDNNKDRKINKIIADELKRSAYDIEVRNFREMVSGHVDVFNE